MARAASASAWAAALAAAVAALLASSAAARVAGPSPPPSPRSGTPSRSRILRRPGEGSAARLRWWLFWLG